MYKKIIKIIIVLLCMITIFSFSSDNEQQSNKKSDGVIIGFTRIIVGHNLSGKEKTKYINKYVVFVRKSAHFTIYFILGLSLISLIREYRYLDIKALLIALIIAILYACSDEFHQLFVSGRSGQITDVLLDSTGSLIGIYIYYLFYKIRSKKYEQEKTTS